MLRLSLDESEAVIFAAEEDGLGQDGRRNNARVVDLLFVRSFRHGWPKEEDGHAESVSLPFAMESNRA